jgi:hypothetical protein
MRRECLLAAAIASILTAGISRGADDGPYRAVPFRIEGRVEKILFADLDGDGTGDLLAAIGDRIEVHLGVGGGREITPGKPDAVLILEGRSVGWDLDRAAGGAARVVALVDGRSAKAWTFDGKAKTFSPPADLAEVRGFLPPGIRHLDLVRDVDSDGRPDLVIPDLGTFRILFQGPDGSYSGEMAVNLESKLESDLAPEADLASRIGQSLTLRSLDLRDTNGDGLNDLVTKTEDSLDLYLAKGRGELPDRPTCSLDLAAVRDRVGRFDPDRIDPSNLTGALAWSHGTEMADIDGDRIEDLLLREGGKVSVFIGRKEGIDFGRPHQVLKSGGNILAAVLHDEDGDGRKDLWLVRVEAVSAADVFLWLVASGSIDFEAFIYRNEGTEFARRPARKITVTVSFPALRTLKNIGEEIDKKRKEMAGLEAEEASLDGRGNRDDVVVSGKGKVRGYLGAAGSGRGQPGILRLLGYRRDRDEYALKVEEIAERIDLLGKEALLDVEGRRPDFEIPLPGLGGGDLAVLDLNGDGIDDIAAVEQEASAVRGAILLSKPR